MVLRPKLASALAAALAWAAPGLAGAAEKTVVLEIPTMDCAMCPITIRLALLHVSGVNKAKVSYEKHEARVTFDDAKTNVDALRKATAEVGYPALESDPHDQAVRSP